jgi:hypothetical protein
MRVSDASDVENVVESDASRSEPTAGME